MGKYEEFVAGIPPVERVFEGFTGVDDRLDFLGPKVIDLAAGINQLLEKEGISTMQVTKQVPLAYTVPATQMIKIAEPSPLTGRITSVTMHFPDGCDGLVHVAFGHSEVWVCPSGIDTYISLNDATPTFPTNEPIEKNENLWAEIRNASGVDHTISVIATIVGVEEV